MAYVLPSTRAKRITHIDQQGQEELEAYGKDAFQASAEAAAQAHKSAVQPEAIDNDEAPAPAAVTPREVIEKLSAAKGELDVVLDLINLMEAQKFMGVANVALPPSAEQKQQQQAIQVQQKVAKLKDAGSRLRRGAAALKAHSAKDHFFFIQLAQLQQHWNTKRSPPGSAGQFQIDVALPLGPKWQLHRKEQQPDALIDILQGPDGVVQLQSAGLPLPDQALRWLTPLPRPIHTPDPATQPLQQAPPEQSATAPSADTVMQDAQPSDGQQTQQQVQQQHQQRQAIVQQQSSTEQVGTQIMAPSAAPDTSQAVPSPMSVDGHLEAEPQAASQLQQSAKGAPPASDSDSWLQLPGQPKLQPQMISVPADLQDAAHASVVRCDRQLLGRQEEIMVKCVVQRVEEEVRLVQGPQDMDNEAVELAQKVFSATAPSPMVRALQLRLLRLLIRNPDGQQRHSLLAELQCLS